MNDGLRIIIGHNIRRERKKKQYRLGDLAEKTGMSKGFLSDVENGKTGISVISFLKIALALDVTTEDLLTIF